MWKWWQLGAVAGLCGLLAACGGGGSGTDDGSPIPARAGEAEIGTSGGTVDAVLEGGTTLRIDIPADALKSSTTLRIEPVPAQAGHLGGFRITPAQLALAKPVTLTLSWSPQQDPPADVALAVRRIDTLVPISPVLRGQELRFEVNHLGDAPPGLVELSAVGAPARAKERAASGNARALTDEEPDEETLFLISMPEAQRLAALRQLVDLVINGRGRSSYAIVAQRTFDIVLRSIDPSSPEIRAIAMDWRPFVCAQRPIADTALNAYEGTAGAVFEQRARASLRWGWVERDMGAALGRMVPAIAPCPDAPDDYRQAVLDKLPAFLERVEVAVQDVPFVQMINDEMPPLIDVEAMLQSVDVDNRLLPLLQRLAVRLRDLANTSCRTGAGQDDHAKLLARATGDAGFIAVLESLFTPYDLRDDIQRCGMRFVALAVDSQDHSLDNVHDLGATGREAEVLMSGAVRLTLSKDMERLFALQCPRDVSANNEQLVVEAGPTPGNMTELTRISSSNASIYLESSPELSFSREALHALRDPASEVTLLRIRRAGGLCSGAFAGLTEHAVLVQLRLVFPGETWVGEITIIDEMAVDYAYESAPFPLFDVEGSPTATNRRFGAQRQRYDGQWNVVIDVVAGRVATMQIASASGTFSRSDKQNTVTVRGRNGCKRTETTEHAIAVLGSAQTAGTSGTLRVDGNGRYELTFKGAFDGVAGASGMSSVEEIAVYKPCSPEKPLLQQADSTSRVMDVLVADALPPMVGQAVDGVIKGVVGRNFPVAHPSIEGATVPEGHWLLFNWDLRRQ